jgi:putative ABC transport system substrate-binding protein
MRRRAFITLLGGVAVAWPLGARAQQLAMPTIGFVSSSTADAYPGSVAAFHRGLAETGYVEGRNVAIEFREAKGHFDQLPALVGDLVRRRITAIVTASNLPPALAAKAATQAIPIVFIMGADPVENGLVASLARPGGNSTGFTIFAEELFGKRLSLLHELVPTAATVAYLVNLTNAAFSEASLKAQAEVARGLGIHLLVLNASTPSDIERAFATLTEQQAGALLVGGDTFFAAQRDQLVALATRHAIPASYSLHQYVESGGLMSYAADIIDAYRQAGVYVGRILKGEKPSDLPVQQPTKFELAINLKTAKALGLSIPPSVVTLADEVIE